MPNLLSSDALIAPLFGDSLKGEPHVFDFSSANPATLSYDPANFQAFQSAVYGELERSGKTWGLGKYLEERSTILRNFPQILSEERIYHAGLDITSLPGTPLFAPLDAVVFATGKEEGIGNYGGFVILKHERVTLSGVEGYSFYGHLHSRHIVSEGKRVAAGERFAVIGDGGDSGGWFTHTHLQLITEEARRRERMFHGYVSKADLSDIEQLFPSPVMFFQH
ncbi:MAG: peptidoglycan DD-metalloendopeptidase family protein [Candidatus Peribacteraceae bacterium]|jgi:murein DD-endopeptidase MepM/ murein hydrolase activator NlpD